MTAIKGTEEGNRRLEEYQEHTNRSLAEHFEWQDKHRVTPTTMVPQEFRPLRDTNSGAPTARATLNSSSTPPVHVADCSIPPHDLLLQ